jgi:uncharacterized membrane protein
MRIALSSPTGREPASPFHHFAVLVLTILAALAAFWLLLGQRFSPENYQAAPAVPYTVEFVWLGAALVAAVSFLVAVAPKRHLWRKLALGALPVAVSSFLILSKRLLNAPLGLYDMLLVCVACGWTTWLWMCREIPVEDRPIGHDTFGRLSAGSAWPSTTKLSRANTNILRVAVWGSVVALAVYQFRHQVWYFNNLALGYADCGENARLMFNSMTNPHELFLRVNPDKPLCYDHINFGIVPFLPLWLFWPDLKLTIALQIVAVFGVAVPLFFIAKRVLQFGATGGSAAWPRGSAALPGTSAALLVVLIWVLYPSSSQFIYSGSYGFRWGNLCLLLYFVALAFWLHDRPSPALACAVWAILIKEEAAIVVGMFGLYLALFTARKLTGAVLAASAFSYFLLATSVLVPLISGHEYAITSLFFDLGHSPLEILLSPLLKPAVFWGKQVERSSLGFAAVLLAPLLFLPLRKPSVLFIASLTFVFCCMSHILKTISLHYQAGLLPVIFWAFVGAIQQQSEARRRLASLIAAAVCCAAVSVFLGAQPWSKDSLAVHLSPGRLDLVERVRPNIDPGGSLFATQRVAAHFVTQRYLYLDAPVSDTIDYALLDLRDPWRGSTDNLLWLERLRDIQRAVEANPHLHLVSAEDGLLLYARQGSALDPRTIVQRDALPARANRQRIELDGGIRLVGITIQQGAPVTSIPMDRIRVTGFFAASEPTNIDLAVRCLVTVNDGGYMNTYVSDFQPLGQCIWPVSRWETNKFYAEDFVVLLPGGLAQGISSVNFSSMELHQLP